MRVLGIDCGSERTGYGVIDSDGLDHRMVAAGVIRTDRKEPFEKRLLEIAGGLRRLIREHAPESAAVEEVFYSANVKTALKLAHVRGVALLAIAEAGMDLAEYSPLEIKISVVGYGRAEKSQVQMMVAAAAAAGGDRIGRRLRRPGGGHLPRHARIHQAQAGIDGKEPCGMKWTLILLFANVLCAGDGRRLFYSRSFPGSVPAYFQVTLDEEWRREYREAPDDDHPLKFQLTEAETDEVFGLAEKLDYFKHPLESPVKVAFMGTKTFRYENGERKSEVKFNYTEDPQARELLDWFERMAESAQHRIELERTAKYDRLGVVKALLLLESAMEHKRLVGRTVPAHAGPHRQERKLHAHGAGAGGGDRRGHSQPETMRWLVLPAVFASVCPAQGQGGGGRKGGGGGEG